MDKCWIRVILFLVLAGMTAALNSEARLVKDLFANYTKIVRPVSDFFEPVVVKLDYHLGKIEQVDEKKQQMVTFGWLNETWTDSALTWDPNDYGGVWVLVIPSEEIWKPEIAVVNSVENLEDQSYVDESRVRISPDGTVMWLQGLRWATACTMDLMYFPFDTQVCSVVFANWVHKRHLLEFININSTINLEGFTRSGEWDLSNGNTFDDTMRDPVHGDIQRVGFTLHLKRIPNYFIFNINIPITMLMLISAVAYILPPEAGEKIGLQITLLLAFSVMLLVISDNTPKVGTTTPILTIYVCISMCQLTASLIITACLLNIYHHRPDVPPPVWLRKLVNGCLASLLCINCGKRSHCRGKSPKDQYNPSSDTPSRSINLTPNHYAGSQEVTLPGYIHKYVIQRSEQVGKASMDEFNKGEWQNIARILDRLFFVTFTIFNTLISVVILISLNQ